MLIITFFIGLAIGAFLFDVLVTRPLVMQVQKEWSERLKREISEFQSLITDYRRIIHEHEDLKKKTNG